MNEFIKIDSISTLHQMLGLNTPYHPLITVIDYSKCIIKPEFLNVKIVTDFYVVSMKTPAPFSLRYGRQYYDFQEGTLIFMAPNQVFSVGDLDETMDFKGWVLFFHPDLIITTALGTKISRFNFFNYSVNEALHVSESEKERLNAVIESIQTEYESKLDNHSHAVICTAIEQLLNYSQRYYDRQFITRQKVQKDVVIEFEQLLISYFRKGLARELGLPQVGWFAEKLHYSSGYLSDLLKAETGKAVKEHIQLRLIEEAKYKLLNSNDTISEIAYSLGFEYPQYFNKLFVTKAGCTPKAYRKSAG